MKNLESLLNNFKLALLKQSNIIIITFNPNWVKILSILYREGFIQNYIHKKHKLIIYLRYFQGQSALRTIKIFNTPTKKLYINKKNLWLFSRYNGVLLISTSKGLKTHEECLKENLGGSVLFFIN